jgi:hypothetical protein
MGVPTTGDVTAGENVAIAQFLKKPELALTVAACVELHSAATERPT